MTGIDDIWVAEYNGAKRIMIGIKTYAVVAENNGYLEMTLYSDTYYQRHEVIRHTFVREGLRKLVRDTWVKEILEIMGALDD